MQLMGVRDGLVTPKSGEVAICATQVQRRGVVCCVLGRAVRFRPAQSRACLDTCKLRGKHGSDRHWIGRLAIR